MTEEKRIKALEEQVRFQRFVIVIIGIVLMCIFTINTIDELITQRYWKEEIDAMVNSSVWYQVKDNIKSKRIIGSLKAQNAIGEKDRLVYAALNDDESFGIAMFYGPLGCKTFVTYDYDKKHKIVKVRFACIG